MTRSARRRTVAWLGLSLAATGLFATGLARLRLGPGMPLPRINEGGEVWVDLPDRSEVVGLGLRRGVLLVLAAAAALLLVGAAWRMFRGLRWRKVAAGFVRGLMGAGALAGFLLLFALLGQRGQAEMIESIPPPPPPSRRTPLGEPPSLLRWLVAAGVATAAGAALAGIVLRPRTGRERLELVGLAAERARAVLLAGGDAGDAIVACYARMSAALAEEQGNERPSSTTASEFVEMLASLGLPRPPVEELTRLFELVRYGGRRPSPAEEVRALACLTPIVEHCRSAPPPAREEPR